VRYIGNLKQIWKRLHWPPLTQ